MTTPPPCKRIKLEETYLISIEYEDGDAYPVLLLMHGIAEEDASLMEYIEKHQEIEPTKWLDEMLLAIERRIDDKSWRPGKEMLEFSFSTSTDKHIQWRYGNYLPHYAGRIDRCFHVQIPDWASSAEESEE